MQALFQQRIQEGGIAFIAGEVAYVFLTETLEHDDAIARCIGMIEIYLVYDKANTVCCNSSEKKSGSPAPVPGMHK